jgi:hypothetical protein
MNVKDSPRWDCQQVLPQDLAIRHYHNNLRLQISYLRDDVWVAERGRLKHIQAEILSRDLDGRSAGITSSAGSPVWLRYNRNDVMAGPLEG